MPSSKFGRRAGLTKAPAICHQAPPLPPIPIPPLNKAQFRSYVDWTTWVAGIPYTTNELFRLNWVSTNEWQGDTDESSNFPRVHVKFGLIYNPLRCNLLCWHLPTGAATVQYWEWRNQLPKTEAPFTTGALKHAFHLRKDRLEITVHQKPY